jgi:TonB-dependent starch-binding outer membrane protein SusC
VKLKNLSLSYSLPQSLIGGAKIRSIDVYVSSQNLVTWTSYPGYDPELTNAQSAMTQGVEMGVIPNPRSFTLGFRVGF